MDDKGKGKNRGKGKGDKGKAKGKDKSKSGDACFLCGKSGHFARDCPDAGKNAKKENAICHSCGGKGHFANQCPSRSGTGKGKGSGSSGSGKGAGKGAGIGKKGKGKIGNELQAGEENETANVTEEPATELASGSGSHPASQAMSFLQMGFLHQGLKIDFQRYWLLDSGASAHVVRKADLGNFEILKTEKVVARFSAAQGADVTIDTKVQLRVHFKFSVDGGPGSILEEFRPVVLEAYVADVQSNVLSVGELNNKGWAFSTTPVSAVLSHSSFRDACGDIVWFANCPWLQSRVSDVDGFQTQALPIDASTISKQMQPIISMDAESQRLHVMRGHQPPQPRRCEICARAYGVSISKRRDLPQKHQIQADFKDIIFTCQASKESFKVKYLVMVHVETGCLGFSAIGEDYSKSLGAIRDFFLYLGLTGTAGPSVEVLSDAEIRIGKMIRQVQLDGRHILVQRAAPQEHQTVGYAERSVRKLKESLKILEIQLREDGYCLVQSQFAAQSIANYFASVHNKFSVNDAGASPKDELFDKDMPISESAAFCHRVLAEVPESLEQTERWIPAMYLFAQNKGQLGHICACLLDGNPRIFVARHVKLIIPSHIDVDLFPGVVETIDDIPLPGLDVPLDGEEGADVNFEVNTAPAMQYDGKSNPPIEFYRKHGFTKGCSACQLGVRGRAHSVACKRRYAEFVKSQISKAVDIDGPKPAAQKDWVEEVAREEEYTPTDEEKDQEADSLVSKKRFRIVDKSDAGDLFRSQAERDANKAAVVVEDAAMDGEVSREPNTHDEPMEVEDLQHLRSLISSLHLESATWDGSLENFYLTDMYSGCLHSIKYSDINRERIDLCGTQIYQSVPNVVRAESGEWLDPKLTMLGIRREYAQMSEKGVGTVCDSKRAKELCGEWSIHIIGCRWVLGRKIRVSVKDGKTTETEEVRARCVVQDLRNGSSAVHSGFSSPTASVESFKALIAVAGYWGLCLLTGDVSTAYMSSPLPRHIKAVVRLPSGSTDRYGNPLYLVLSNALNGLRPAALAWVLHFRDIIGRSCSLRPSSHDPTLYVGEFCGSWVSLLVYVDDIMVASEHLQTCRDLLCELQKHIEIKETGSMGDSSQGGELTFLGRRLLRCQGSSAILVGMDHEFNAGLLKASAGMKSTMTIPDLKHYLEATDDQSLQPLTAEGQSEFRSIVGRLLWLLPFRPDLAIGLSLVSTGQATPQVRHSRALKGLLKYVAGTIAFMQRFPIKESHLYLERAEQLSTLVCYSDASYAPMRTLQRRSISGGVVSFLGSVIKGFTRAQGTVTLSSAEAELEGLATTVQEAFGLHQITSFLLGLEEVNFEERAFFFDPQKQRRVLAVDLTTDNSAAVAILRREDVQRKLRHTEIKLEYIKQNISRDLLAVRWESGTQNPADALTKVTSKMLQDKYRHWFGLEPFGAVEDIALSLCFDELYFSQFSLAEGQVAMTQIPDEDGEVPEEPCEESASDYEQADLDFFTCQLTKEDREALDSIMGDWTFNSQHRFLLLEFCCSSDSSFGNLWLQRGPKYQVWRVTQFGERSEVTWQLCERLKRFVGDAEGRAVWFQCSLPCTGGSSLQWYRCYQQHIRVKSSAVRLIFKKLLAQVKVLVKHCLVILSHDRFLFTFELAKTCAYWRWRSVHELKSFFPGVLFNGVVRLCCCKEGRVNLSTGISKAWRVISNHESVVQLLYHKHGQCGCNNHEKPQNYALTAFYPQSMCRSWISAVVDLWAGRVSGVVQDSSKQSMVWTK